MPFCCQVGADGRPDDLRADDLEVADVGRLQRGDDRVGGLARGRRPPLRRRSGTRIITWCCDSIAVALDDGVLPFAGQVAFERRADR